MHCLELLRYYGPEATLRDLIFHRARVSTLVFSDYLLWRNEVASPPPAQSRHSVAHPAHHRLSSGGQGNTLPILVGSPPHGPCNYVE
jgi:hypothetical protein